MLKGFKKVISKYAYFILPIGTLLCLAGFIGSYLFPNEVLDTYQVNMTEEEGDSEFVLSLTGTEDEIGYVMETDGRALKGFQIGISKNGAALEGTELIYRVYLFQEESAEEDAVSDEGVPEEGTEEDAVSDEDVLEEAAKTELPRQISAQSMTLLLEKSYDLGTCLDGQYPYLPFDDDGLCNGKLYITFTYRANGNMEGVLPGIFANHGRVDNAATYFNGEMAADIIDGEEIPEMIKHYYIYSHNTYPFLYDCRVMTFVFLAASMTVCYPQWKKKEKKVEKEGETDAV